MDIARISDGHRKSGKITHGIRTFKGWRNHDLRNEESYFAMWIDIDGDAATERLIWIRRTHARGLFAEMYRSAAGDYPWKRLTDLPVWRPNKRVVRIAFKRRWIGMNRAEYRWRATSSFERASRKPCRKRRYAVADDVPPEARCMDSAPNALRYRRHLLL